MAQRLVSLPERCPNQPSSKTKKKKKNTLALHLLNPCGDKTVPFTLQQPVILMPPDLSFKIMTAITCPWNTWLFCKHPSSSHLRNFPIEYLPFKQLIIQQGTLFGPAVCDIHIWEFAILQKHRIQLNWQGSILRPRL